jgi:iron(III) transport system substrate-binding protein
MRTTRRTGLVAMSLAVALAAAGCGGGDEGGDGGSAGTADDGGLVIDGVEIADAELWEAAQAEGTLTLYTSISEDRENAMVDVFREQTGIDVEVIRLNGSQLYERILTEAGADLLVADVVHNAEIEYSTVLEERGIFQDHCPPGLEAIDPELQRDSCGFFISQTPIYALGYNTSLVEESAAPKTWQDLLDPKWSDGKIGLAHIGAGGSVWTRALFLRNAYGVEYWQQLARQEPLIAGGAAAVTTEMARGEVQVGAVLPGNQSLAASQGAPLALVLPEDGVPAYLDTAGLTQAAPHPNAGKVFLNWLIALPGQTAIAEKSGDYPVIDAAPGPDFNGEELPPRTELDLAFPGLTPEYTTQREAWSDEWFETFGYNPPS